MTRLIVITGFIIAFLAGTMAGMVFRHDSGPGARPPGGRESFIGSQLGLSADQQAKMKAIWQDVSHRPDRSKRGQIRKDQEEAIAKLIHPEDRPAYDKVVADCHAKLDQMDTEGRKSFQQAVEKTKAILTPDQLKKYDVLLARNDGRDRDRPATRPTP